VLGLVAVGQLQAAGESGGRVAAHVAEVEGGRGHADDIGILAQLGVSVVGMVLVAGPERLVRIAGDFLAAQLAAEVVIEAVEVAGGRALDAVVVNPA